MKSTKSPCFLKNDIMKLKHSKKDNKSRITLRKHVAEFYFKIQTYTKQLSKA